MPLDETPPSGHDLDEDGEHDEDECWLCLHKQSVENSCRCAECCKRLIIEVTLQDAEREPKIKELGSPIFLPPQLTASGERELDGYMLNGAEGGCVFLDKTTNLCKIHDTRPLVCRLFDCEGEGREQLIELGILPRSLPELGK